MDRHEGDGVNGALGELVVEVRVVLVAINVGDVGVEERQGLRAVAGADKGRIGVDAHVGAGRAVLRDGVAGLERRELLALRVNGHVPVLDEEGRAVLDGAVPDLEDELAIGTHLGAHVADTLGAGAGRVVGVAPHVLDVVVVRVTGQRLARAVVRVAHGIRIGRRGHVVTMDDLVARDALGVHVVLRQVVLGAVALDDPDLDGVLGVVVGAPHGVQDRVMVGHAPLAADGMEEVGRDVGVMPVAGQGADEVGDGLAIGCRRGLVPAHERVARALGTGSHR